MNTALFLSDATLQALGWTLVHSLWQAALIGLALTLALPRLTGAQQRYRASYGAMLAVLACAVITCGYYYCSYETATPVVLNFTDASTVAQITLINSPLAGDSGMLARFNDWFETNHSALVFIWLTGFVLLLLRMAGGLWYLRRIRSMAGDLPAVFAGIAKVTKAMSARYPVRVLQSAIVYTPVAFGFFKPVILLPVGLLNHLSIAEVEAVVMHELGHITRRDWLMNLIQTLVEAIFYYHPVVWWMSSVVGQERERCCDEWAIARIKNDRLTYARALLRVQEYALALKNAPVPALALGAEGPRTFWFRRRAFLLERIQTILLQSPQQKSMIMERMLITGLLMATLTFWGLQAAPPLQTLAGNARDWFGMDIYDQTPLATRDSVPPAKKGRSVHRISEDDGKQKVELEVKNGDITRLNIDGREIPPSEYNQHKELTNRLINEQRTIPPVPPVPPVPPMPPVPGMPPAPPAPPAPPSPRGWGFSSDAPGAPFFFNGSGGQVIVDKTDKNGTVIQLNNGGKPTEIVVKDGVVTIDGKPVEEGESLNLDGARLFNWSDGEGKSFGFGPREAPAFHFEPGERGVFVLPPGMNGGIQIAPDINLRLSEHLNENLNEHLNLNELQHQLNENRWQNDMPPNQFNFPTRHPDAFFAPSPGDMGFSFNNKNAFSEVIVTELSRDHLITDPDNYSVELSPKKLKVNGKKQPGNMLQKYLELYKRHTGKDMTSEDSFEMSLHR